MSRSTWGTRVLYGGVVIVALLGLSLLIEHRFGAFSAPVLDSDVRILLFSLGLIALGPFLLVRYSRMIAAQSSPFRLTSIAVLLTLSVGGFFLGSQTMVCVTDGPPTTGMPLGVATDMVVSCMTGSMNGVIVGLVLAYLVMLVTWLIARNTRVGELQLS